MSIKGNKIILPNLLKLNDYINSIYKNIDLMNNSKNVIVMADLNGDIGYNSNYLNMSLSNPSNNNNNALKIENNIIKVNPDVFTPLLLIETFSINTTQQRNSDTILYNRLQYYENDDFQNPHNYDIKNNLIPANFYGTLSFTNIYGLTPSQPISGYSLQMTTNSESQNIIFSPRNKKIIIVGISNSSN